VFCFTSPVLIGAQLVAWVDFAFRQNTKRASTQRSNYVRKSCRKRSRRNKGNEQNISNDHRKRPSAYFLTMIGASKDGKAATRIGVGFVTLHSAFHPENGDQSLAVAIREQQLAENKWGAVWAEATLVEEDVTPSSPAPSAPTKSDVEAGSIDASQQEGPSTAATAPQMPPWRKSNLFEMIFGITFTIAAVASTFGVELAAALVFVVAATFYNVAAFCKRQNNIFMYFWWAVFGLVYVVLQVTDAILLTVSVFVAELLAALGCLMTFVSGHQGLQWHQYIRKLCHLTRWAFRDFHSSWEFPKRTYPLFRQQSVDADTDDEGVKVEEEEKLPVAEAVVAQEVTMI